jgi:hypothetical protein
MDIVLGRNPIRHDRGHKEGVDGPYCDAMTGRLRGSSHPTGYCYHRATVQWRDHWLCGMHLTRLKSSREFRKAHAAEMATVRALILQWRGDRCVLEPEVKSG